MGIPTNFTDAEELVRELTARGLIEDGRLAATGRELVTSVLAKSEAETGQIWRDLPPEDVEATTRILNELLSRARAVLR